MVAQNQTLVEEKTEALSDKKVAEDLAKKALEEKADAETRARRALEAQQKAEAEKEAADQEVIAAQQALQEATAARENAQRALDQAKAQLDSALEAQRTAENAAQAANSTLQATIQQRDAAQAQIAQATREKEAAQQQAAQAQAQVAQATREKEAAQQQATQAQSALTQAQQALATATANQGTAGGNLAAANAILGTVTNLIASGAQYAGLQTTRISYSSTSPERVSFTGTDIDTQLLAVQQVLGYIFSTPQAPNVRIPMIIRDGLELLGINLGGITDKNIARRVQDIRGALEDVTVLDNPEERNAQNVITSSEGVFYQLQSAIVPFNPAVPPSSSVLGTSFNVTSAITAVQQVLGYTSNNNLSSVTSNLIRLGVILGGIKAKNVARRIDDIRDALGAIENLDNSALTVNSILIPAGQFVGLRSALVPYTTPSSANLAASDITSRITAIQQVLGYTVNGPALDSVQNNLSRLGADLGGTADKNVARRIGDIQNALGIDSETPLFDGVGTIKSELGTSDPVANQISAIKGDLGITGTNLAAGIGDIKSALGGGAGPVLDQIDDLKDELGISPSNLFAGINTIKGQLGNNAPVNNQIIAIKGDLGFTTNLATGIGNIKGKVGRFDGDTGDNLVSTPVTQETLNDRLNTLSLSLSGQSVGDQDVAGATPSAANRTLAQRIRDVAGLIGGVDSLNDSYAQFNTLIDALADYNDTTPPAADLDRKDIIGRITAIQQVLGYVNPATTNPPKAATLRTIAQNLTDLGADLGGTANKNVARRIDDIRDALGAIENLDNAAVTGSPPIDAGEFDRLQSATATYNYNGTGAINLTNSDVLGRITGIQQVLGYVNPAETDMDGNVTKPATLKTVAGNLEKLGRDLGGYFKSRNVARRIEDLKNTIGRGNASIFDSFLYLRDSGLGDFYSRLFAPGTTNPSTPNTEFYNLRKISETSASVGGSNSISGNIESIQEVLGYVDSSSNLKSVAENLTELGKDLGTDVVTTNANGPQNKNVRQRIKDIRYALGYNPGTSFKEITDDLKLALSGDGTPVSTSIDNIRRALKFTDSNKNSEGIHVSITAQKAKEPIIQAESFDVNDNILNQVPSGGYNMGNEPRYGSTLLEDAYQIRRAVLRILWNLKQILSFTYNDGNNFRPVYFSDPNTIPVINFKDEDATANVSLQDFLDQIYATLRSVKV